MIICDTMLRKRIRNSDVYLQIQQFYCGVGTQAFQEKLDACE